MEHGPGVRDFLVSAPRSRAVARLVRLGAAVGRFCFVLVPGPPRDRLLVLRDLAYYGARKQEEEPHGSR